MFPLNVTLIEERLGLRFSRPELWHHVCFDEMPDGSPPPPPLRQQLLAYRGDKIIDLVIADHFVERYPEHQAQHGLWRSGLASNAAFHKILEDRGMLMAVRQTQHPKVMLGIKHGGTMFEAITAVHYTEQGLEPARAYLHATLLPRMPEVISRAWDDFPAMRLGALCAKHFRTSPDFLSLGRAGSRQRQAFAVRLTIAGVLKIDGYGHNPEAAKERAIHDAFEILRRRGLDVDAPPEIVLAMTSTS